MVVYFVSPVVDERAARVLLKQLHVLHTGTYFFSLLICLDLALHCHVRHVDFRISRRDEIDEWKQASLRASAA